MNPDPAENNDAQSTPEDFYRAFAIAVLMWQGVEHVLFNLMFELSPSRDLQLVGEAYYGRHSFGPKLRLVDQAAKATLKGEQLAAWLALKDELELRSEDRNWLAHATYVPRFREDNTYDLVLTHPVFVPVALRRLRATYDAAECNRATIRFRDLARAVEAFTRTLA